MPAEQRWTCIARIQIPDIRARFRRYHFWYYVQPAKMLSARGWQDGEQFHPLVWKCCKGRNWFLVHSYTASSSNNAWHIVEQSLINIVCALYCMNKSGFLAPKRRKGAKIIGYQQANIHLFEEGAEKFTTHEAGCETATLTWKFPLATQAPRARCRSELHFNLTLCWNVQLWHTNYKQETHKDPEHRLNVWS